MGDFKKFNLPLDALPKNPLFMSEEQRQLVAAMSGSNYRKIPTVALQSFKDHPYHIEDDEDMERLAESIKLNGVLQPLVVRTAPNKMYEIISGHRRRFAAEKIHLDEVPCYVYDDMSDEDAAIIMADSNLHREHILPSERAFAYKMKADALRKKLMDSSNEDEEIIGRITEHIDADQSRKSVENYIRLTYLTRELLELVDLRNIPVYAGVDLSYLTEGNQIAVFCWISDPANIKKPKISLRQAANLRKLQSGEDSTGNSLKMLEEAEIREVMLGKKQKERKLSIPFKDLEPFIPGVSNGSQGKKKDAVIRDYIMKAVIFYRENHPEQIVSGMEESEFFDESQ